MVGGQDQGEKHSGSLDAFVCVCRRWGWELMGKNRLWSIKGLQDRHIFFFTNTNHILMPHSGASLCLQSFSLPHITKRLLLLSYLNRSQGREGLGEYSVIVMFNILFFCLYLNYIFKNYRVRHMRNMFTAIKMKYQVCYLPLLQTVPSRGQHRTSALVHVYLH